MEETGFYECRIECGEDDFEGAEFWFKAYERDFELRGQGDLLGVRQSGDMVFKIADLKRDLKRIGKDPLNINEYASYSPGGCHYWEEEEELYLHQKYYAYLMYFRKLVKLVEDEIRKQKRLIKEAHREQNRRNQEHHKASRSRPKNC